MPLSITHQETDFHVTGTVKWFDPGKGFGFIEPSTGGPDILLHANVLRSSGVSSVSDGSRIEVGARRGDQGFQAFAVYAITPPGADDSAVVATSLDDLDLSELVPARIKWFNRDKGYGFANAFGQNDDIFVGLAVLRDCGLADLQSGEAVAIRIETGEKGKTASHVLSWGAGQPHNASDHAHQPCRTSNFYVV